MSITRKCDICGRTPFRDHITLKHRAAKKWSLFAYRREWIDICEGCIKEIKEQVQLAEEVREARRLAKEKADD